jgi:predicted sulfurtransferase
MLAEIALPVVNIAAYRFAPLADLQALRSELLAFCRAQQLRGTILLSTEGINLSWLETRQESRGCLRACAQFPVLRRWM